MIGHKDIYWGHVTLDVEADCPADALAFFHQIMQLDLSAGLVNILKESDGHGPGTEAPKHHQELIREVIIKKIGKRYKCYAMFDFEVKHKIVRLVTPWLSRFCRLNLEYLDKKEPGSITLNTSFYCIDYPEPEWTALCNKYRRAEPETDGEQQAA